MKRLREAYRRNSIRNHYLASHLMELQRLFEACGAKPARCVFIITIRACARVMEAMSKGAALLERRQNCEKSGFFTDLDRRFGQLQKNRRSLWSAAGCGRRFPILLNAAHFKAGKAASATRAALSVAGTTIKAWTISRSKHSWVTAYSGDFLQTGLKAFQRLEAEDCRVFEWAQLRASQFVGLQTGQVCESLGFTSDGLGLGGAVCRVS